MSQYISAFLTNLARILPYFLVGSFFFSTLLQPLQAVIPIFILFMFLSLFRDLFKREEKK